MPRTDVIKIFTLAALLSLSQPLTAQTPAIPDSSSLEKVENITLQHIPPGEVITLLHWDRPADLPPGVTKISAGPEGNALAVVATPEGLAAVEEVVRLVDVAPRRVQIKLAVANVSAADLQTSGLHGYDLIPVVPPSANGASTQAYVGMATGKTVARFLTALAGRHAAHLSPPVTTTNNAEAQVIFSGKGVLPTVETLTFAATPRVNSDETVTLSLHPNSERRTATAARGGRPVTVTQEIRTFRTISSGDTLMLINPFSAKIGSAAPALLLFVTPTLLPAEKPITTSDAP